MTYKLICLDMDGVLFKETNFWMELHKKFGTYEKGKELTKKYLHTDYNKLVEEVVVKLWKGKDAKLYYDLVSEMKYMLGIKELFAFIKKKGLIIAIISASSIDVARRVQKDFGADHIYANELIIRDNRVSGEFVWPIGAGKEKKVKIVEDLCKDLNIPLKECIYIGDDDTDVEISKEVGLAIAFNPLSEELKQAAKYVVESDNLKDVIPYLKKELM